MQIIRRYLETWFLKKWYNDPPFPWLYPFTWIYQTIIYLRRRYYQQRQVTSVFNGPVIVVGNLTVGGTGKTPLVVYLAKLLKAHGMHPGIVMRGYQGNVNQKPVHVLGTHTSGEVGDEALLLYHNTDCPIVVSKNRVKALPLLAHLGCDIILSDDGLQHYALARTIEILVIDGVRRFGNGCCLPSGPLREPVSRMSSVNLVVVNGGEVKSNEYLMRIIPTKVRNITYPENISSLSDFKGKQVHAVAGIGNPDRFFDLLRNHDIEVIEHRYPDHYHYHKKDLVYGDELPILMTEKDAIKCQLFSLENSWVVMVEAELSAAFNSAVFHLLKGDENE